jgi:hypothetical protein
MIRRAGATWKLLALLLPLAAFVACDGADPRTPTTLAPPASTQTISATVAAPVPTVPTVTLSDQKGRGLAGVWVKWLVTSGGGRVVNDSSQTGADGVASSGGWTLGTGIGTQTLTASAAKLTTVTFTANAAAGPVASLVQVSTAQAGVVNTVLASTPAVKAYDGFSNPVAGAAITFTVVSGGGIIAGATETTGADGVAAATSWQLGSIAGDQKVLATATATSVSIILVVRAVGGAPTQIALLDGNAQVGEIGRRLCQSPSVIVTDAFGNAVAQVPVTFSPTDGSSTVTTSTVLTDTSGSAAAGAWIPGSGGTQTVVATSPLLPGQSVSFTATTGPAPAFTICARFIGTAGTARQRLAVTRAIARWQSVIVAHADSTDINLSAAELSANCAPGLPAINERVVDVLLFVQLSAIDGPRGILARSAPCYIHSPANVTAIGFFQLDTADADLMLTSGTLDNVVLHEIGHILGIGTLWNFNRTLLFGAGTVDSYFAGAVARDQFTRTGSTFSGNPVPVENCVGIPGCGAGTRDSHWRKSVFNNELMQGYARAVMPLSAVTIGSLADLGYTVNLAAADPFSLLPSLRSANATDGIELGNDIMNTKIIGLYKNGAKVRLPSPPSLR